MPLTEPLYAGEQIHIPPELPEVLKQFTKAAIKTQPDNTYLWAAQYFEALAANRQPPVKSRLVLERTQIIDMADEDEEEDEYEEDEEDEEYDNVTREMLAALVERLRSGPDVVTENVIRDVCTAIEFPDTIVDDVIGVAKFDDSAVNWKHFVTLACASIPETGDLIGAMKVAVQVFGENGAMALDQFSESYLVMADLDPAITDKNAGLESFVEFAGSNGGMVTAAAFGAASEEEEAAADEEPEAEGTVHKLVDALASGPLEVTTSKLLESCAACGYPGGLVDIVVRVGKFGDSINWVNFASLLIANAAGDIEETATTMVSIFKQAGVAMDDIKTAHLFISELDNTQTPEQIAERVKAFDAL